MVIAAAPVFFLFYTSKTKEKLKTHGLKRKFHSKKETPGAGIEPTTTRLKAERSTTELTGTPSHLLSQAVVFCLKLDYFLVLKKKLPVRGLNPRTTTTELSELEPRVPFRVSTDE